MNNDLTGEFDFSLDDILAEFRTPPAPPSPAPAGDDYASQPIRPEEDEEEVLLAEAASYAPPQESAPAPVEEPEEEEDDSPEPDLDQVIREYAGKGRPSDPVLPPEEEDEDSGRSAEELKASIRQIEEDDDGEVKVYTPPAKTVAPPAPPEPDQPRRKGEFPTMKFKAVAEGTVAGWLAKRKRGKLPPMPAAPSEAAADTHTYTQDYSDAAGQDGQYAAYQDDATAEQARDFRQDFGLGAPVEGIRDKVFRQKAPQKRGDDQEAEELDELSFVSSRRRRPKAAIPEPEEDLGPEVSPRAATRFYGSRVETYRARLRIAAVLCVIMAWLTLGLPVPKSLNNTAVCAAMCLILMLTVTVLGLDIFVAGLRVLVQGKPDAQTLTSVACLSAILDAALIISRHGEGGYLPYCVIAGVSMCFAIYSAMLYCRGHRLNFRVLSLIRTPSTVSVERGIVNGGSGAVRTPGYPDEYIHISEEADLSETAYCAVAPFLLLAVPVLTILAAYLSKNWSAVFHILSALYTASAAFSSLLGFSLPYFLVTRDLFRSGSAIAGWTGAKILGSADAVVITDTDLFPEDTISIESVRILEGVDPQMAVSYISSVVAASGSCLSPVFMELLKRNNCVLHTVESFTCHEAGGLTAMIDGMEVQVGSSSFIKLRGIHLPQKLSSKNALFLAVNSRLVGIVSISYKATVTVQRGLAALLQNRADVVFATRDFNVTPLLISQRFKVPSQALVFPSLSDRYRLTDDRAERTGEAAAVMQRRALLSFADVVTKARKLYSSVSLSVGLSVLSSFAGVILMFFLCCSGSFVSASPGNLLLFMLLWLVPTLVCSIGGTK